MKYNQNTNNEYVTTDKGNADIYNYNTNQMCNRCQLYKTSNCPGKEKEMFLKSINHYCPHFKDRNYTEEQSHKYWHLEDFVRQFKN